MPIMLEDTSTKQYYLCNGGCALFALKHFNEKPNTLFVVFTVNGEVEHLGLSQDVGFVLDGYGINTLEFVCEALRETSEDEVDYFFTNDVDVIIRLFDTVTFHQEGFNWTIDNYRHI